MAQRVVFGLLPPEPKGRITGVILRQAEGVGTPRLDIGPPEAAKSGDQRGAPVRDGIIRPLEMRRRVGQKGAIVWIALAIQILIVAAIVRFLRRR